MRIKRPFYYFTTMGILCSASAIICFLWFYFFVNNGAIFFIIFHPTITDIINHVKGIKHIIHSFPFPHPLSAFIATILSLIIIPVTWGFMIDIYRHYKKSYLELPKSKYNISLKFQV